MLQDLFTSTSFRAIELTAAFERIDYVPDLLGQFGEALFPTTRSRFRAVAVFRRDNSRSLVPVSPIGAPPVELEKGGGEFRLFSTKRLAKGSTIYAEELQGVLQLPRLQAVADLTAEVASRGVQIRQDLELTEEHMRFGALMGKVMDADGVTVLDDFYDHWDIAEPTAVNFALNVATTNVRDKCTQIIDAMQLAYKGGWVNGQTVVHALADPAFFALLISHPMVERAYLGWSGAMELNRRSPDEFEFGGIIWHKFRPSDDGAIAIPAGTARFFPVGARNVFGRALGPAEFEPFINRPGQDIYAMTIPDRDRGAWQRVEGYKYPLYFCLRPEVLQRATAS